MSSRVLVSSVEPTQNDRRQRPDNSNRRHLTVGNASRVEKLQEGIDEEVKHVLLGRLSRALRLLVSALP